MEYSVLDRVFAYGTLQVGGCYHHLVAPFLQELTEGSVPGILLDLGEYPGWVEGHGNVRGQLMRLHPIVRALRLLDELEDYRGPGHPGNLYQRVIVEVVTARGTVSAWGYRYVGSREGYPSLPGGRWIPG